MDLDGKVILEKDLAEICRYRQNGCCKYIVYLESFGDFYCAKKVSKLRSVIESQSDLHATGDNCEGLPHEKK